jgi:hypothetical protein
LGGGLLRASGLFLGYLLLAGWFTWPLAGSLATRLPCSNTACSFDTLYSAWVVAWVSHALGAVPARLGDANIYVPDSHALYYGPAGFGAVPYFLPTFLATANAALALNVMVIVSAAATACGLHWVVWRWTGFHEAGFVAAWNLFVNRWYLWGFAASAPHLVVLQYFPWIVYAAAKPLATPRQAGGLLALILLQSLTDPVYVAPAVLAVLGSLALARLVRPVWRRSGAWLALVLAALPVCLIPFLAGYSWVRAHNPALTHQTLWTGRFGAKLYALFPLDVSGFVWRGGEATSMGPAVLVTIVLGALVAIVRGRSRSATATGAWANASLWAVVGTLVSLPPVVRWGDFGGPQLRLPHYLLDATTPVYDIIRLPTRLGFAGMIGLCLLFGVAFAEILRPFRRVATIALTVSLAALVYRYPPVGQWPLPSAYPTQPVPHTPPALLHQLRATEGPLLEIPALGIPSGNFARPNAVAMYRSTQHWRPLLNGYSSYWPSGFRERLERTALLPAPRVLRRFVCETGLRTILVNLAGLRPPQRRAWLQTKARPGDGLELIGDYPGQLLFAVTIPLPGAPGGPACPPLVASSTRS